MTESSSSLSISQPCNDIGNVIHLVSTDASSLSNAEKYSLLFEHVAPPLTLPTTFSHGCNRRFNTKWLQKYPWLRYSPKLDAVLCGAGALLMKSDVRQDKGWLVNKPFSNWVKLSDMLSNHSKFLYHLESLQDADILRDTIQTPASRIDVMCSSSLRSQMAENSHILRQIVHAVLFLSKQGLALWVILKMLAARRTQAIA